MLAEREISMHDGLRGRLMPWLFKNQDDKKPPKGFEKFFKKREEQSASNPDGNINLLSSTNFSDSNKGRPSASSGSGSTDKKSD